MNKQRTIFAVVFLLLVAAGARLFHLGERVLWFDEAVSMLVAKADINGAITAAWDDTHPPFYNILLHFWLRFVSGETGARLLSVVCGVAAVAVVFCIGEILSGRTAAIFSSIFLAVAPLHVWYSQEVRMYGVQTFFVCLSWLSLLLAVNRGRIFWWVLYAVATSLSFWAQYTSAFSVLAQIIWVLAWHRADGATLKRFAQSVAAAGILFLPCAPLLLDHLRGRTFGFWLAEFSRVDAARLPALFTGAIQKNSTPYWPWAVLAALLLAFAAIILVKNGEWRLVALAGLWVLVPVALLALMSLKENVFLPRTIVYIVPAFALLMGVAVARALESDMRLLGVAAAALLLASNLWALRNYYFSDNWRLTSWIKSPSREVSWQVEREFLDGDIVIHSSRFSYRPFQYYLGQNIAQGQIAESEPKPNLFKVIGDGRLDTARDYRRIWLVLYPDFQQPQRHRAMMAWMEEHHRRIRIVHESPNLLVALYERQGGEIAP
jgi:uncharacterized membrane protein